MPARIAPPPAAMQLDEIMQKRASDLTLGHESCHAAGAIEHRGKIRPGNRAAQRMNTVARNFRVLIQRVLGFLRFRENVLARLRECNTGREAQVIAGNLTKPSPPCCGKIQDIVPGANHK